MPNTLPPDRKEQPQEMVLFWQAPLPSQAGNMQGCHTTDNTFGRNPGQVGAHHHLRRGAPRQLSRSRWDGGCSRSSYSRVRLGIKFYLWSLLGYHLEYLSSGKKPLQVLLPRCLCNYSGSFCLNLSFTKVGSLSEIQSAHLYLI